ncbi:MAG: Na+/H+ antiporter subunit E [Rhodoferax sp.]|nr:Na+/H+ antiporter subunit E [Rhodoferax sp.]
MTTLRLKLLPSPLLSAVLALAWPVLNQSWSLGQLVLGLLLALVLPWYTEPLRHGERPALRAQWVTVGRIARLFGRVLADIVRSNITVAQQVLGPESALAPGYVWYPLTLTDSHAKITLAGIITLTPGTLSADFSEDGHYLLVHALNLGDEAALIAEIHARYEAPLMEIFA